LDAALAPLAGRWDLGPERAVYLGTEVRTAPAEFGLVIADDRFRMRGGRIRASVFFPDQRAEGRLIFGRSAVTNTYFSAGVGGYGFGYVLNEDVYRSGVILQDTIERLVSPVVLDGSAVPSYDRRAVGGPGGSDSRGGFVCAAAMLLRAGDLRAGRPGRSW